MLTEIRLDNFRVFDKEVIVRIRPITVLIGRNSAGKSSLIKFLLMLQQSLVVSESGFLSPEGERVHLGAFVDLRNSVSKRSHLQFQLTFRTDDVPPQADRMLFAAAQRGEVKVDPTTQVGELRLRIEPVDRQAVQNEEATYEVAARVRYSRRRQTGEHSVRATLNDKPLLESRSKHLRSTQFLQFPPTSGRPESVLTGMVAQRLLNPIRSEVQSWRHLSAVREESQRAIVIASPPSDDVGQMGEYAMPHLQRVVNEGGDRADFVLKHLAATAEVKNVRFDSAMKGYLAHCRATNQRTKGEAYLSDFGFGVSQCLPIFVQGALMRQHQLLMVEQPEAQLHPTAQLEMGGFFADLWKTRQVMSLIETHSPQIILRLRGQVAKETLNPEDISIAYVFVNDAGVPSVKNLDVDARGQLEKGLPAEFFGADIIESAQMAVRK